MFVRDDQGLGLAGGAGTRSFGRALLPVVEPSTLDRLRSGVARIDWVPDLGAQVGSATWWRGVATCVGLCVTTAYLSPTWRALPGASPAPLAGAEFEEARTLSIAPIAFGASTGRRLAPNDLVVPLTNVPERPVVELSATIGDGDSLGAMLQRAGVGREDAAQAAGLVAGAVRLDDLEPGTVVDLTLGRRASRNVARPLEQMRFRASFDLKLALTRTGGALTMDRQPIAVDRTPLRIQGLVGTSLYRSARAAGVPARVVEAYIKALATRVSIGGVGAADTFDIVADQARAATGEVQIGDLQYAGLDQGARRTQLVRWTDGAWWDAQGQSERRGFMGMPVAGRITSTFGPRMHPLLRFTRMHKGLDIGAPPGTPIHAPIDGIVAFAGRNAGYGNFVKLVHGGGLASGYGHMSRFAVSPGMRVSRGQVIGYVGSTGMSTGPHLHWEVWRNGQAVNPQGLSLSSVAVMSGETLRAFKAKVAGLLAVRPGGR